MHLFISAGEPSGDLHAANLTRAVLNQQPDAQVVGFGGDRLVEAGARVLFPLARHSVMWFPHVFQSLGTYLSLLKQADDYFRTQRPDALVMIDYPGFHWWLARRAKRHGIPVYYFVPPQLWAWGSWRIRKMRRFIDYVICSLPFEVRWFAARGIRAFYFGHPTFDELARRPVQQSRVQSLRHRGDPIVALLPGSRNQEVAMNWPSLLVAARTILEQKPDARFLVAAYSPNHADVIQASLSPTDSRFEILLSETPEAIEAADLAIAVSGSVSLELLSARKPSIITYRINFVQDVLKRMFMKVPYMSLVNLLAGEELYPEFLSRECSGRQLGATALRLIDTSQERARIQNQLEKLRERVAIEGSCVKTAQFILKTCRRSETRIGVISSANRPSTVS